MDDEGAELNAFDQIGFCYYSLGDIDKVKLTNNDSYPDYC